MYTYIDKLLSYKYEESKKVIENIDKLNTKDYLSSCIVFIYDEHLDNSFFNELEKYSKQKLEKNENVRKSLIDVIDHDIPNQSFYKTKNLKIISSDVCGLGKSFQIKKMINEEHKKYYHIILDGILASKK